MEENPIAPTPPPPVIVKKGSNIPLVGAIIFLALTIIAAAIYLGTRANNASKDLNSSISPTSSPLSPSPILEPTTTPSLTKTQTIPKLKDSSFVSYSIEFPTTWIQELDTTNGVTSTFSLTKDGNEIKIYQAPMGGTLCIFEGEMPENFGSDYRDSEYVDIATEKNTLRRIIPEQQTGKVTYSFCGNNVEIPGVFNSPTQYGAITYTITDPTPEKLTEMDNILKTLR